MWPTNIYIITCPIIIACFLLLAQGKAVLKCNLRRGFLTQT